jgi:AcrR family transcriptional regulator
LVTKRLTRAESRERTRADLLKAAARVFVRDGIEGASVEDIANAAGYTRGAFYSNFKSKDDLVLALIDERMQADIAEIADVFERDHSLAGFVNALYLRAQSRPREHRQTALLYTEFWLYAVRHPRIRPRIAERQRRLRDATAELIETQFRELGVALPIAGEIAASVVLAIDEGLGLLSMIDPDSYPQRLFLDVLLLLQRAVVALAREGEQ